MPHITMSTFLHHGSGMAPGARSVGRLISREVDHFEHRESIVPDADVTPAWQGNDARADIPGVGDE